MPLATPAYPKTFQELWTSLGTYIDDQDAATLAAAGAGSGGTVSTTVAADTLIDMVPSGIAGDLAPTAQDTGIWYRKTRIRPPAIRTRLVDLPTAASFTSGATGVTTEATPDYPSGSVVITAPGLTRRLPTKTISPAVDLSNVGIRFPVKLWTGPTADPTTRDPQFLYRCRIEVSSDGFAGTDSSSIAGANRSYAHFQISYSHLIYGMWSMVTLGPGEWTSIGTGANLSSINAIRFHLENNSSSWTSTLSTSYVETFQLAPKAKCVLCFDDYSIDDGGVHWSTAAAKMVPKGFPGVFYANIAQFKQADVDRLRYLQRIGWQVAAHSWTGADHNSLTTPNDALVKSQMKARQRLLALGFGGSGIEDFAWYGNQLQTPEMVTALRPYHRTGRLFVTEPRTGETLPPGEPLRLRGWGLGQVDIDDAGAGMIGYINKAIANRGLAVLTWHNTGLDTGFDNILNHLNANRDKIDVVTMERAMAPYLDSTPEDVLTSSDVSNVRVLTQAQYTALSYKDPRVLYVVT